MPPIFTRVIGSDKHRALAVILFAVSASHAWAQSHSGFPVDITSGPAPAPINVNGRRFLVYELHLTNYAPLSIELTQLEVLNDGRTPLASYSAERLQDMTVPVEELSSADSPSKYKGARMIGAGHAVVIFLEVNLNNGAPMPSELSHRFSFSVVRQGKPNFETTLNGPTVAVSAQSKLVVRAPVGGAAWIAFNAFGSKDHPRSFNAVDGKERICQRFAIDWMRLGRDGRLFRGAGKSNGDYYGFGAEVLAVADGRVTSIKDGLAENSGATERSARSITLDNVFGNYVILDLGAHRFAEYAHLQAGSLRVKAGDRVKAGQVIALLGNSGNSDAPHLHFQIVDRDSTMASEGIPFGLELFTQLGLARDDSAAQDDSGVLLLPSQYQATKHRHEFPVDNAVVSLP